MPPAAANPRAPAGPPADRALRAGPGCAAARASRGSRSTGRRGSGPPPRQAPGPRAGGGRRAGTSGCRGRLPPPGRRGRPGPPSTGRLSHRRPRSPGTACRGNTEASEVTDRHAVSSPVKRVADRRPAQIREASPHRSGLGRTPDPIGTRRLRPSPAATALRRGGPEPAVHRHRADGSGRPIGVEQWYGGPAHLSGDLLS